MYNPDGLKPGGIIFAKILLFLQNPRKICVSIYHPCFLQVSCKISKNFSTGVYPKAPTCAALMANSVSYVGTYLEKILGLNCLLGSAKQDFNHDISGVLADVTQVQLSRASECCVTWETFTSDKVYKELLSVKYPVLKLQC